MQGVEAFEPLAISLGLGMLVGLQRERLDEQGRGRIAGIRTFPLITLLGTISAMVAKDLGPGLVIASLAGIVSLTLVGTIVSLVQGTARPGITTEVAILLMFGVGVLLATGHTAVAVVVGGGTAVLLNAKPLLRGMARGLAEGDFRAIMQFALVSLVILPVLPDETFGPFPLNVLNPRKLWLLVVLVTGVNLAGYLIFKFVGQRAGMLLGGVLGGLVSSTATTLSFSRQTAGAPHLAGAAAFVVMVASGVVWVRVLILIAAVSGDMARAALWPFMVVFGASLLLSFFLWRTAAPDHAEAPQPSNPTNLREALLFAALFAVVQVSMAWIGATFGTGGVYALSIAAGLTEVTAVALSTAELADKTGLSVDTAWRALLAATMANLVFKGIVAIALGSRGLKVRLAVGFAVLLLVCAGVLVFWPGPSALAAV